MQIITFLGDMMQSILLTFSQFTGNYGLAIILLTLMIRGAMYPLTLKQVKSAAAMRELQPQLKALQEKYKDKPQEYQKRMMALWRENKVNPLGGCLPILVQMPFLFALFTVLREFPEDFPVSPQFLFWDLSAPDPTYLLPIISGLTTYVMMNMTMTDPSQKAIMMIMPVFIAWISIQFPAGLVLYWVVSNVFSIAQQHFIMKGGPITKGGEQST